jgi:hypothetical protein
LGHAVERSRVDPAQVGRTGRIDPPARGASPRQGTRRERTPPKRGQVDLLRCAERWRTAMIADPVEKCSWPAPSLHRGAYDMASSPRTGGQWIAGIVTSGRKLRLEGKLHGVLSRARLCRSRVPGPDWSTGAR